MDELYSCLKKNYERFNCFDIKQRIGQINKINLYASLDSPVYKEHENLHLVSGVTVQSI